MAKKPVNVAAAAPAAAPAPAAEPVTQPPVSQPPAAAPPAPTAKAAKPAALVAGFKRLDQVRDLPEVLADAALEPIEFEPDTIEQFMASDTDRRVMRVVGYAGGFASQEV